MPTLQVWYRGDLIGHFNTDHSDCQLSERYLAISYRERALDFSLKSMDEILKEEASTHISFTVKFEQRQYNVTKFELENTKSAEAMKIVNHVPLDAEERVDHARNCHTFIWHVLHPDVANIDDLFDHSQFNPIDDEPLTRVMPMRRLGSLPWLEMTEEVKKIASENKGLRPFVPYESEMIRGASLLPPGRVTFPILKTPVRVADTKGS